MCVCVLFISLFVYLIICLFLIRVEGHIKGEKGVICVKDSSVFIFSFAVLLSLSALYSLEFVLHIIRIYLLIHLSSQSLS